ncbi:putative receptor protein kinase ZmPK1 [Camellia lanceoleosa]|uniref:Receptor protein kinase ZmPK1 n=1 Tax=Camellia lanceoleosa TaxID=1840588 RepID=A0ACC0HPC5_9ERIC|nr:putative receptor protein kinase ZmPK1 [Camellia lanceoleosa]
MVLTDVDGSMAWQTNTSSTDVDRAELLETGNLVLKNSSGNILWQSFDFPTDTLLPFQTFTKSMKLISGLRNGSFASGYFSLYFDNDNVLRLIYDGPEISSLYWPNPDLNVYQNERTNYNSSRIAVLDDMGVFLSSDRLQFSASDMGFGVKRRLTMDYDGNLRLYSLNLTGMWVVSWEALTQPCNVHGLCGRNGVCVYAPEPKCSCPPGYEVSDPSDWNQGCKPKFNLSCSNSQQMKFVELPYTDYYGFDLNYSPSISIQGCRNLCLDDCHCQAFSYRLTGQGVCYTKSALFNGYQSPSFPGKIYLKLPVNVEALGESEQTIYNSSKLVCRSTDAEVVVGFTSMYDMAGKRAKWVYLYAFASAIGAIEILIFVTGWVFFRRHDLPDTLEDGLSNWVVVDGEEAEAELTRFVRIVKRKNQCGEESWLEEIVDPRLGGQFSRNQAATLVEIGVSCIEEDRNKRPTMASVLQILVECEEDESKDYLMPDTDTDRTTDEVNWAKFIL